MLHYAWGPNTTLASCTHSCPHSFLQRRRARPARECRMWEFAHDWHFSRCRFMEPCSHVFYIQTCIYMNYMYQYRRLTVITWASKFSPITLIHPSLSPSAKLILIVKSKTPPSTYGSETSVTVFLEVIRCTWNASWGCSVITHVYPYVGAHDNNSLKPRQRVHHFAGDISMHSCMKTVVPCLKNSESNQESYLQYTSIDSDDGLVPNRQHAIIRPSADTDRWRIHRWYSGGLKECTYIFWLRNNNKSNALLPCIYRPGLQTGYWSPYFHMLTLQLSVNCKIA